MMHFASDAFQGVSVKGDPTVYYGQKICTVCYSVPGTNTNSVVQGEVLGEGVQSVLESVLGEGGQSVLESVIQPSSCC
jgi:hypothetical protein